MYSLFFCISFYCYLLRRVVVSWSENGFRRRSWRTVRRSRCLIGCLVGDYPWCLHRPDHHLLTLPNEAPHKAKPSLCRHCRRPISKKIAKWRSRILVLGEHKTRLCFSQTRCFPHSNIAPLIIKLGNDKSLGTFASRWLTATSQVLIHTNGSIQPVCRIKATLTADHMVFFKGKVRNSASLQTAVYSFFCQQLCSNGPCHWPVTEDLLMRTTVWNMIKLDCLAAVDFQQVHFTFPCFVSKLNTVRNNELYISYVLIFSSLFECLVSQVFWDGPSFSVDCFDFRLWTLSCWNLC